MTKHLGLRLNLPDNGAVGRSLLAVLVLAAIALYWGPAGAATSTAAAGAIAGAIALAGHNPLGRIPIVLAVSVELGTAVLAGGLTAAYSAVFVVVVALWCFSSRDGTGQSAHPPGSLRGRRVFCLSSSSRNRPRRQRCQRPFAVVAGLTISRTHRRAAASALAGSSAKRLRRRTAR